MSQTDISLQNLRCEYHENPIGVDAPKPRFSWQLAGDRRGLRQKAYQLKVARSKEALAEAPAADESMLWDSGLVESTLSTHVRYEGSPLESFRRYYWTVVCWDDVGDEVRPGEPVSFYTGAVEPVDLTGSWITTSTPTAYSSTYDFYVKENHTEYHGIYLRKDFACEGEVTGAYVIVAATGWCELLINGEKVGDRLLDPAPTDYHAETLYSCYDVTEQVRRENRIVGALGNGRNLELHGYETPALFVHLRIELADGRTQVVTSDDSWRSSTGPIQENEIYRGERYDARLETAVWSLAKTPEDKTPRAVVVEGPTPCWQSVEPILAKQILRAKKMSSPGPGFYIYDFGQNLSGIVRLRVRGPRGTEITIRHAELLYKDGSLNVSTNRYAAATDVYVLKGSGDELYQPSFTYHGFRYAEISGYPGVPDLDSVAALFVHSAVPETGVFACSNELINRIHQNARWGQLSNLVGIPTDSPQRAERMGWLGDAWVTAEEAILNFGMASFYTKFLKDIRTSQRADGALSDTAPHYWDMCPADPVWGSGYIMLAWTTYWHYGDGSVLEEHYPSLKRYVDYLHSLAEDGVIGGIADLLFGDWCPPGSILPKRTPVELTSTWCYYRDTLLLSRIAATLGREAEAGEYRTRAEEICAAFNREFLVKEGYRTVVMGPKEMEPAQTSNLLPLYLNMVPADRKEDVTSALIESIVKHHDYHVDTGLIGTRYLFDVLTQLGQVETAFKIATQESYPGWGYMISQGATTMWERWEKLAGKGMNSRNHIMLGCIDAWFYETIAGIRPVEAGWRKIEIKPHPVEGLDFAAASVETVVGTARVSWERTGRCFRCRTTIPPGATGRLALPFEGEGLELRESSELVYNGAAGRDLPAGVDNPRVAGKQIWVETRSGDYVFEVLDSDLQCEDNGDH